MAFFSRPFPTSDVSFTPLFQLLDDFDKYSRQGGNTSTTNSNSSSHNGRRSPVFHWQPKFDVRETADAYELHGELPGLDKENVSIEFPELQQMIVRGKVERTYTSGTPPSAAAIEGATEKPAIADAATSERRNSHQATVEDEADAEKSSEVTTTTKSEAPAAQSDKAKYWLTERSIGEFSRVFSFPARVDQDAVSASLKDGILSVTVPKAKKHESRRVAIL